MAGVLCVFLGTAVQTGMANAVIVCTGKDTGPPPQPNINECLTVSGFSAEGVSDAKVAKSAEVAVSCP